MNRICLIFDLLKDGSYPELPYMFLRHTAEDKYFISNVKLIGRHVDFDTNTLRLFLSHPFFPELMGCCVRIGYNSAKLRYPFLFTDTNPLLYKKFGTDISWTKQTDFISDGVSMRRVLKFS